MSWLSELTRADRKSIAFDLCNLVNFSLVMVYGTAWPTYSWVAVFGLICWRWLWPEKYDDRPDYIREILTRGHSDKATHDGE